MHVCFYSDKFFLSWHIIYVIIKHAKIKKEKDVQKTRKIKYAKQRNE